MLKILFVCMANICRSPLAEGIMLHLIKENDLENKICVASAGTHSTGWHEGDLIDEGTITISKQHGIDISHFTSSQLKQCHLEHYDLILVADKKVYNDAYALAKTTEQQQKIQYLLQYNVKSLSNNLEDPYYTRQYQKVFNEILLALKGILSQYDRTCSN